MATPLHGKVAAITGAASGIGLASAEAMLAAGARVVLIDRDAQRLAALRERLGENALPLVLDLLDAAACKTLMPQVLALAGRLDIAPASFHLFDRQGRTVGASAGRA